MENGRGTPKGASHGGVSPWNFLELGFWASSALPLSAATATASGSTSYSSPQPPTLSGVDAICRSGSSSVTTSCLPFSDRRLVVPVGASDGDHLFFRGPPPQQQQQQQVSCLKLGKRQYYVAEGSDGVGPAKRPVALSSAAGEAAAAAPRCQVDGCNKALMNEKEYHRRHKVCEMHSKVPKVVLLGSEQRFCQQCSRFHVLSEFDDTKRSCRRRLAGHNERRRKSSNDSNIRNPSFDNAMSEGMVPLLSISSSSALSLLSSKDYSPPWVSTSDLSSRSSAALRELIAENRAAVLERQLFTTLGGGWNSTAGSGHNSSSSCPRQHQVIISHNSLPQQNGYGWNQFHEVAAAGNSLTLDLMQLPSCFQFLSERGKSKEEEEEVDECCEILNSLAGAHVI